MINSKPWYSSKTIWSGIFAGVIAIYNGIAPGAGWPAIPEYVFGILAAFGIYGRATATAQIAPNAEVK